MEFVGSVFEILKSVWEPIYQGFNYFRSLNEKIESLNGQMEELGAQKTDLKRKLDTAEVKHGKKPKKEVQVWLKNVEKLTSEVKDIEGEVQQGRLSNYWLRTRLSKLAENKIGEAVELKEKGRFAGMLFDDPLPIVGMIIPTTTFVGKTTAERTLETIWECLMDAKIGTIGVWGMGGIGKTTIMMKINNQLIESGDLFDSVIWVTVSRDFNLEKIQKVIAEQLNLDLSEAEDEITNAASLFQRLARKKFAIMLDDMWDAFPLEKVGIPKPNRENGCKILLTTRLFVVCQGMESQRTIKVVSLSQEEAWELFKYKVGDHMKLAPEVEQIAKLVAQECACLPLAIITVGRAMKERDDIREWRHALNELRDSTVDIKGMDDEVFEHLKFSYKRLRNDRVRECFLFCALYPEGSEISSRQLIEYWIAEGLIEDLRNREAEIDKGYIILKELINACMLDSSINYLGENYVKTHDLIRDMAINITRESQRWMVKAGVSLKEFPKNEKWMENVERIYLMYNDIQLLSGQPKCPKLLTLLLNGNPLLWNIQHSFFKKMHNLRVLDLSKTKIEYLPKSISGLENLRALLLHGCVKLTKVPSLAKLKELRVLDLSETKIEELPPGMDEALNLRHLNLSCTRDLQIISSGALPKLSLLEDLLMSDCGWKWPWKSTETSRGAGVEDIIRLTRLSNLSIHLEEVQGMIELVKSEYWKLLKRFYFVIEYFDQVHFFSRNKIINFFPWNKIVYIGGCNIVSQESFLVFPDNTQCLSMENCTTQLSELLNLKDLKYLYIRNCDGMECINMEVENTLSNLEILELHNLPSLRTMCKEVMPSGTLTSLKKLLINRCHKLNCLLPIELLCNLQNLENIQVISSMQMEEILGGEEEMSEASNCDITLPMLKMLDLRNLPGLKRICKKELVCESLQSIYVWDCPHLKKLPFSFDNIPPTLKKIEGTNEWWDALEWDDLNIKALFQPFFYSRTDADEDAEANTQERTIWP